MTGRHRGSGASRPLKTGGATPSSGFPESTASVEPPGGGRDGERTRSRRLWLIAAVTASAVLLGWLVAGLLVREGRAEQPGRGRVAAPSTGEQVSPSPQEHPTYGKYVPPRIVATGTVIGAAPAPRTKPTAPRRPRPNTSRPPRMRCPDGWEDVPPLRAWCEQQGLAIG